MSEARVDWAGLESFAFGDNPELAQRLAELVLAGIKRATCWPVGEGQQTHVGKRMLMLDGGAKPAAIVETTELSIRRFDEVDAAFAFDEGEGDRSLEYWRAAHTRYFTRRGTFTPDMLLFCERFRVVARLADPAGEE